ncbi:DNA cytosine methyltransferase [Nitrosomonas ureae]|uniref:DNA (cytosine-5-)-methyltransferase n=1 Tax=Nitrosomonas ureae TaxID=44577 RepID=A0A286A231_9PROT|nr:DNA cytosine methyltransferase [Nitrosomonas ureae]SOD15969.1 DNA (cytosine-5)-methyltransferase 1 [Nitrosomonas ureae]
MNELALFAGAGGGILGGKLLGWRTVCAVERNAYAAQVLAQRQNDGIFEPFPIWSDVQSFDGKPWKGIVDVISGGFPCQDISVAGKGEGIDGEQSGMWKHMARIIDEIRPRFVFVENSPLLVSRGLVRILGDLASMGFHARWGSIGAFDAGYYHNRKRLWIVAYTDSNRSQGINAKSSDKTRKPYTQRSDIARVVGEVQQGRENRIPESWILRASNGMANRMDRTIAIGNGQVPGVAARAWNILNCGRGNSANSAARR